LKYKKKELINGIAWSAIEKLIVVILQLSLELILARNLLPKDYGIMGIVAIFISLGTLFAEGGFSNALIHNLQRNNDDFSTAFYFNIFISVFFVIIFFSTAPVIAEYFKIPVLVNVLRVTSLSIIFGAASMVYRTKLSIDLDFKTQAKVSFIALIISGTIGVIMAISNYGVWSLVAQVVLQNVIVFLLFVVFVRWLPNLSFSLLSFKKLISFGSSILMAGLLQNLYSSLYNLLIGKRYSTDVLGLYSKSNQFTLMPSALISGILQRVMFPYFATFQSNDKKIFYTNQIFSRIVCIVVFPIFIYLAVFAEPLVFYGLSDKWIKAVPIIQILAIAFMFQPLIVNNMVLFQVKNKTKLYFWLELITKITGITILFLTIKGGIYLISLGILLQLFLQFLITGFSINFILREKIYLQFLLLLRYLIYGVLCFLILFSFMNYFNLSKLHYWEFGSVIFLVLYILFYWVFEKDNILTIFSLLKNKN